jgi:hypothetical protein
MKKPYIKSKINNLFLKILGYKNIIDKNQIIVHR